jgi:hypothetical protein
MSKLRTLDAAIIEIRKKDPETSLTRYALRQAVIEGRIPCVMCGRKRLVDVSRVFEYLIGGEDANNVTDRTTDNAND